MKLFFFLNKQVIFFLLSSKMDSVYTEHDTRVMKMKSGFYKALDHYFKTYLPVYRERKDKMVWREWDRGDGEKKIQSLNFAIQPRLDLIPNTMHKGFTLMSGTYQNYQEVASQSPLEEKRQYGIRIFKKNLNQQNSETSIYQILRKKKKKNRNKKKKFFFNSLEWSIYICSCLEITKLPFLFLFM